MDKIIQESMDSWLTEGGDFGFGNLFAMSSRQLRDLKIDGIRSWGGSPMQSGLKSTEIAGIALAGLLIVISYKVYKSYMSKAAVMCKQFKGGEKKVCIVKYKNAGAKQRIELLTKNIAKCNMSKHPVRCKKKLQREIIRLQKKMGD